ncbi:hypothetical protein AAW12_24005 [Sphingobacterium sp. Ag1]|uniref:hypothetical protein n=1 Tax=Sphingobacterium sp. Ag1 TaxID=1643451 RepID=UPI000627D431|nr:hypothetical protein [Sphingobacterium sp. Ag1]KKO89191.1 hypothetical protein AAW12_24005 [Sphingobacterium sp. Ag1]
MKLSDTPTKHFIIEANTYSEFDCCDYAIVHISDEWITTQKNRIASLKTDFPCREYTYETFEDFSVNFHMDDCEIITNTLDLLEDKKYSFIELETEELQLLSAPQEQLASKKLILYKSFEGHYVANGMETGEEFWTAEFPLKEIIDLILNNLNVKP